jgi:predicted cobalt transporter CbtA
MLVIPLGFLATEDTTMMSHLLVRGMLVGILAGLCAFGFARFFAEPQIEHAIAFEEQASESHVHHHETSANEGEGEVVVSRETQAGWGLLTGMTVFGAAVGGLFALAFAFLHGRAGPTDPRKLSLLISLGCFVSLVLLPSLIYPANPPAVGSSDSIAERTVLFYLLLIISVATLAASVQLAGKLRSKLGHWNASLAAVLVYLLTIGVVLSLMPTINEVPHDFPADVLWKFRITSMGTQTVLWGSLGIVFGWLTERSLRLEGRIRTRRLAV